MTRDEQENIVIREVDKRIDQIVAEFELDAYFVLGYLSRTMHRIQRDMDLADEEEEQLENEDND